MKCQKSTLYYKKCVNKDPQYYVECMEQWSFKDQQYFVEGMEQWSVKDSQYYVECMQ